MPLKGIQIGPKNRDKIRPLNLNPLPSWEGKPAEFSFTLSHPKGEGTIRDSLSPV
jgi:hypothetical protein